jgi:hypothetical protein
MDCLADGETASLRVHRIFGADQAKQAEHKLEKESIDKRAEKKKEKKREVEPEDSFASLTVSYLRWAWSECYGLPRGR